MLNTPPKIEPSENPSDKQDNHNPEPSINKKRKLQDSSTELILSQSCFMNFV